MKRGIIYSILALCLSVVSCSKEPADKKLPVASSHPVEFQATNLRTKGADALSDLDRLAAQKFSVSAWYTPDAESFGSSSTLYIKNHSFGRLADKWRGVSSEGDADPVYYPLDGTLTYFCYAPYRADVSSASDVYVDYSPDPLITSQLEDYLPYSPLISFTPSENPGTQIDFIAATPLVDKHRSTETLTLDFTHHLTTNVQFWVKKAGTVFSGEKVQISRIEIHDVINEEYLYFTETAGIFGFQWCGNVSPVDGSSTMPLGAYVLSTATGDLITEDPYLSDAAYKHVNNTINGCLYLLPHTIPAGAYLDLTYIIKNAQGVNIEENIVRVPLTGTWPVGRIIKYNITVNVATRKVVELTTEITPWVTSGNSHAPQEIMY